MEEEEEEEGVTMGLMRRTVTIEEPRGKTKGNGSEKGMQREGRVDKRSVN